VLAARALEERRARHLRNSAQDDNNIPTPKNEGWGSHKAKDAALKPTLAYATPLNARILALENACPGDLAWPRRYVENLRTLENEGCGTRAFST